MFDAISTRNELREHGRVWLRGAVDRQELSTLATLCIDAGKPGARADMSSRLGQSVASSKWAGQIADIWPGTQAVRALSFGKSLQSNWAVPWHQDRIIAVEQRHETPGFTNWSQKAGVWHCEPPADLLSAMLFVRVHIDRNDEANGAMEIARGSHQAGLIPAKDAARIAQNYPTEVCIAQPGDILVLAMLTLHRSKPAENTTPRRAIRVDFAAGELPTPLAWQTGQTALTGG